MLSVTFCNGVHCYRSTDESYLDNLLSTLGKQYSNEFYWDWTFLKVTNSEYLQWLSKRSNGISDYTDFIHFSFLGVNDNLDVITTYKPIFEITLLD